MQTREKDYHAKRFLGHLMGNWSESSRKKFINAIREYKMLEDSKLIIIKGGE